MSALIRSTQRCCHQSALLLASRRLGSSSSAPPLPLHRRLLLFLTQRFYDVEMLLSWQLQRRRTKIQRKNAYYAYTESFYGRNIAAAYYVLNMRGGFRFAGQTQWFCGDQRGKFSWDFLNHKDGLLEDVNMSHTLISHTGLTNLEGQKCVRTLSLRGCPEVDDWFLARLHIFQDSLEELDISHCPRITICGLPALRNLKRLRRLDVSSLPRISNPGLVIILLEEMLPQCYITATGYDLSLRPESREGSKEQLQEIPKKEEGELSPEPEDQSDDSSEEEAAGDMDFLRNLFSRNLGIGTPDKVLDDLTLEGVAQYIKSGKCKNIICMVGAGISTSAGIPDFRSPGTGLYANLQKYNLPYPEAIFQIDYFKKHPEPFFALARELYPGQFKPTVCHYFMRMLKDKGLLRRCYSQNIDTLERVAGLEGDDLIEAHGTFYTSHCVSFCCRKEYTLDWMKEKIFSDDVPRCEKCNSLVKPDIVFFGESLPLRFFTSVKSDFPRCDLLIIMGTSLQVQPFASLVSRVSKGCPRLLINMEKAGQANALFGLLGFGGGMDFDSDKAYRDVAHISTCDDGCLALADLLGWKAELEELVKQEHTRIDSQDKGSESKGASAKASSSSGPPQHKKGQE